MFLKKGDLKKALEHALMERKLNPSDPDGYILSAEILHMNRDYRACAQEYQKALKYTQPKAIIYISMATCYRLAGDLDIAEQMINLALSLENGRAEIYREQGAIFEAKQDFRSAALAYQRYLELSPNAPDRRLIENRLKSLGLTGFSP